MAAAAQTGREEVYVVIDLQDGVDALPLPGTQLQLQSMDSAQPVLQLADGTRLLGAFEEAVGTHLVLADTVSSDGSHRVELVGHTDKRLVFRREAAMAEEEDDDDGEAAAGSGGRQQQQQQQQQRAAPA